jgi:CRISPR/Cas system-associated endonuclease Cas1
MGFLHSPKPGRLSLSYDVLEYHRARLTRAVFEHVARQIFERADFEMTNEGIVKLASHIARDVADLVLNEPFKDYTASVKRLAGWF